ncbi:MAG: peptide chain release factor N(5)-glutamine methyltransferase, partial [Bacteroidota bacterium]
MNQQEIYRELLDYMSLNLKTLPDKPEENPENTLHALWLFSCGIPSRQQNNSPQLLPELNEKTLPILKKLIQKRIKGTPLAHLTGVEKFMNIEFKVDSRALI